MVYYCNNQQNQRFFYCHSYPPPDCESVPSPHLLDPYPPQYLCGCPAALYCVVVIVSPHRHAGMLTVAASPSRRCTACPVCCLLPPASGCFVDVYSIFWDCFDAFLGCCLFLAQNIHENLGWKSAAEITR
ncbi:uncharacterized protein BDR25DRAFT_123040 [Lindgomyces ingoldianus]|uniref:Uncharacterized protein n=1 Tax=Lindgomyces ingoldianus TaxID=673940 RepID=A0ACB6Q8M8_9PLEO|nr:uncharacterized protein BDR25DRAFT_123040 [Lindgomyces ingoldianus]KAF2462717.1 hypothetical protein BDR25DRAFT_123040 [Lindgomyces ingoldianus]